LSRVVGGASEHAAAVATRTTDNRTTALLRKFRKLGTADHTPRYAPMVLRIRTLTLTLSRRRERGQERVRASANWRERVDLAGAVEVVLLRRPGARLRPAEGQRMVRADGARQRRGDLSQTGRQLLGHHLAELADHQRGDAGDMRRGGRRPLHVRVRR